MSNPTNLQELADNLVLTANDLRAQGARRGNTRDPAYLAGYADALLDTRATVLSMIAEAGTVKN